jgi:hypothetical protein
MYGFPELAMLNKGRIGMDFELREPPLSLMGVLE